MTQKNTEKLHTLLCMSVFFSNFAAKFVQSTFINNKQLSVTQ